MTGGQELLLLAAVIPLLVRCQSKPTVSISPPLTEIFTGDLFYLHCKDGQSGSQATWSFNDTAVDASSSGNNILRIPTASLMNSGNYKCTISGQTSDQLPIKVHAYVPIASLTIQTGHPVVRKNSKVILEITNDDGLYGWECKVNRGEETKRVRLKHQNATSLAFETTELRVPETIYWCYHNTKNQRSNQVILRTTVNEVTLEMYPFPAIAGERMTLRCLVWGTDEVKRSVFYKENTVIKTINGESFQLDSVNQSNVGKYKCVATYRHKGQTISTPHQYGSDAQEVLVYASPVRAQLSDHGTCTCPACEGTMSYRYYKKMGNSWKMLDPDMKPSHGIYHCRAVSDNMRTLPSSSKEFGASIPWYLGLIPVGLIIFCVAFYCYKKRKAQAAVDIYEQVQMRPTGDANYEALNVSRMKGGEYDTIQPGSEGREKKGGEYEALAKTGTKEEVYHTLGDNVASGGEGGYEALKREGVKKDEYDTLKTKSGEERPGTTREGGDGGYEALKREGVKRDEYDTLKTKSGEERPGTEREGGDGGYEALKREGVNKDEYETLKTTQAEGGSSSKSQLQTVVEINPTK
ncbi:PREDICTED: uncharacterized protein LOC107089535 [Cyprinodon variegatus]|uniref:uncharacterized protein LOC107089535 n=1 Tax=Cyprinodon variegatus TaxID=28743 RepID=UPI00074250F2|nr:PREDICTED: uncharacterized protein LOC107089535 [Cyprinodon variegatus]